MREQEYDVKATNASVSPKAGPPLKIRCVKRSDLCREYVLVGRSIPTAPDTASFTSREVTATFQGGKLVVAVANKALWARVNQAAANAVAKAAGGSRAQRA